MKLRNKILIVICLGVWLLPLAANMSLPMSANEVTEPAVTVNNHPKISVTSALPSLALSIGSLAATGNCGLGAASTATLIQDQIALSLNQPANCFTVVPESLEVQPELAVNSASSSVIVKVDAPTLHIASYKFVPTVPQSSSPILPLSSVTIAVAIAMYAVISIVRGSAKKLASQHVALNSLSQLQMMRC